MLFNGRFCDGNWVIAEDRYWQVKFNSVAKNLHEITYNLNFIRIKWIFLAFLPEMFGKYRSIHPLSLSPFLEYLSSQYWYANRFLKHREIPIARLQRMKYLNIFTADAKYTTSDAVAYSMRCCCANIQKLSDAVSWIASSESFFRSA